MITAQQIRVRFAPSPTGYLHIGGARTAFFNWIFAKKFNGKFILRLEDTDKLRSQKEYEDDILESLKWLGLDWDEGPYRQSERMDIYNKYIEELLKAGSAYKCYCKPEDLELQRQSAEKFKQPYKYDRKCLNLTDEQKLQNEKENKAFSLRFKIPVGETIVNDIIRGNVKFDNLLLDDFVIVRSDKIPTYNFCVVVDDALMNITHIIRGEDHLSNTPRQILLYKTLGFELPKFVHIPLILGIDKTRLSKRHGATSVAEYRKKGYLPEAMLNFLVLLGWGYDDKQQIFSIEEVIQKFSLEKVTKNPAVFDNEKLNWLNGLYIRNAQLDRIYKLSLPYFREKKYISEVPSENEEIKLQEIVKLEKDRLKILSQITDYTDFFFTDEIKYEEVALEKYFKNNETAIILENLLTKLRQLENFSKDETEKIARATAEELNIKFAQLVHPVRLAITGRTISAGLFEVMAVLGKGKSCLRIQKAIDIIKNVIPVCIKQ
ncbi:MAG: glutamate--tRNA ligase [Candidatus Firestonebacteria bacterium]